MKNEQRLIGTDKSPVTPDAVLVLKNRELAIAVGEYVEKKYGVTSLAVVFEMVRPSFGSFTSDVSASIDIKKEQGKT